MQDVRVLNELVAKESVFVERLLNEVGKVIVGQTYMIERILIGLLTGGHVLLEGVPGLAKTLALKTLAGCIAVQFKRLQFTPDMLPADIVGTLIYNPREGTFHTKHGPIFSNFVLADEINRAPAKVQSALLEAMQERQVTIGGETFLLDEPFLVMATQNPIEQEGTYPLPEAQMDRFMLKVVVGYPNRDQELLILDRMSKTRQKIEVRPVTSREDIMAARATIDEIYVDRKVQEYIVDLVMATRKPQAYGLQLDELIQYGASPRATIFLTLAAKANAFLHGRGHVVPQDIKEMALDVLRHRVILTYEAEAEEKTSDEIISTILNAIPVP